LGFGIGSRAGNGEAVGVGGWLRLVATLLLVWEPLAFAVVAAGAMNAVQVRGAGVGLVLVARLIVTALCIAAGRALLDERPSGPLLARLALSLSAGVQLFAYLTPYFPSNRLPGDTPIYIVVTLAYYGGWFLYLLRSRRVAATYA
jgi:hypothetical protein